MKRRSFLTALLAIPFVPKIEAKAPELVGLTPCEPILIEGYFDDLTTLTEANLRSFAFMHRMASLTEVSFDLQPGFDFHVGQTVTLVLPHGTFPVQIESIHRTKGHHRVQGYLIPTEVK